MAERVHDTVYLTFLSSEPGGRGKLLRCTALKGRGDCPERFDAFVYQPAVMGMRADRLLSLGLKKSDFHHAESQHEALLRLLEFAGDADVLACAGANGARDLFLAAAESEGLKDFPYDKIVGVEELAGLVAPRGAKKNLSALADELGVTLPEDDLSEYPENVRAVWLALEAELLKLPLPVLAEFNWILAKTTNPLKGLLKSAENRAVAEKFDEAFVAGQVSYEKLFKDYSQIIDRLRPEEDLGGEISIELPEAPVLPAEIEELLGNRGPLAAALDGYEERPEQTQMAVRTAEALNNGLHLVVEAGTGVGKSLAYLIPAILFAKRAGRPVMISTHTKNLQSQLYHKDIPFLKEHLGIDFNAALLKGRSNYLCLRKLMYTLQESPHELDEEDRAEMLPVISWASRTDTGDAGELAAFAPEQNPELWGRLHTTGDDCLKRQCPFYKRCFVYKARGQARGADLVIANHSLVFADLNIENGSLPPYNEIVFDEAHKLEEVATEHLGAEISQTAASRILHRLCRSAGGAGHAGKGLLPSLLSQIENARGEFPGEAHEIILNKLKRAISLVHPAEMALEHFFLAMRDWHDKPSIPDDIPIIDEDPFHSSNDAAKSGGGSQYRPKSRAYGGREEKKRFFADRLSRTDAEFFKETKEETVAALSLVRIELERLDDVLKEIKKKPKVSRGRELATEITAQAGFLNEFTADIEFIMQASEPGYVYWSEAFGKRGCRLCAAPLEVGAILHEQLFSKKRSVIMASATFSVRDRAAEGSGLTSGKSKAKSASFGIQIKPAAPKKRPEPEEFTVEEELNPSINLKPHPKSFEYLKSRFGLSYSDPARVDELLLGSPFDYESQCRLAVPSFLPEPGGANEYAYTEALNGMIHSLATASGGRALVLYTSYAALNAGANALRRTLGPEGIEVVAQGEDGSREHLLARLKAGGRTVLLGTSSFWEGVDVRGDALSLLIIAKLPFAAFKEPIIEGRCELLAASGKDPFLHYSVPNAILKLRQGFGRLIRSKKDTGVVVLADRRVLTKRYGAAFLRGLPARHQVYASLDELRAMVAGFIPGSGVDAGAP